MATKTLRSSVGATIVQVWALPTVSGAVRVDTGLLGLEISAAAANLNSVVALTNGTAAAAGTVALVPLGGTATVSGALPRAVPLDFGPKGFHVDQPGGLGIKMVTATAGTVTGFFSGVELPRS